MAKKQSRRSISVRRDTYVKLRALGLTLGRSMSDIVEERLTPVLADVEAPTTVRHGAAPRVKAAPSPAPAPSPALPPMRTPPPARPTRTPLPAPRNLPPLGDDRSPRWAPPARRSPDPLDSPTAIDAAEDGPRERRKVHEALEPALPAELEPLELDHDEAAGTDLLDDEDVAAANAILRPAPNQRRPAQRVGSAPATPTPVIRDGAKPGSFAGRTTPAKAVVPKRPEELRF